MEIVEIDTILAVNKSCKILWKNSFNQPPIFWPPQYNGTTKDIRLAPPYIYHGRLLPLVVVIGGPVEPAIYWH